MAKSLTNVMNSLVNPSWVPIEQGAMSRAKANTDDQNQNSTVNNSSVDNSSPIRINPLTYYASYTPLISFQVTTPDNYNTMMQEVESKGYQAYDASKWNVICQSGGVGPNKVSVGDKKFFVRDLFIDDFEMHCVVGQNQQNRGSNVTDVSWTINEPNGMDLIEELWDYCKALGESNYLQLPYLLKISFRGYADDGTNVIIDELTKYIPIHLLNMEIKLHSTGAIYKVSAIPYNEMPNTEAFGRIDADIETWGTTIFDFCGFLSWKLNQHQLNYTKRDEMGNLAQQYADEYEIISLPLTINGTNINIAENWVVNPARKGGDFAPKDSKMGAPVSIGTKTNINTIASNTINNLHINPNSVTQTTANVQHNDGTNTTTTNTSVTSSDGSATFSTYEVVDNNVIGENAIRFNAGSSILDCINSIVINSNYITPQITNYNNKIKDILNVANNIGPDANSNAGIQQLIKELDYPFQWFIITTRTELLKNKYDRIRNCNAAKYTYCIQPYMIDNAKILSIPNGNPSTRIVKEYDYILTGKNTEILNLDLEFKTSFITYAQSNIITKQQGSGAAVPAKDQTSDVTYKPSPALLVSKSTPIGNGHLYLPAPSSNKNSGMVGEQTPHRNMASDIASTIYAPAEMLDVKLTINGDPDYIKQDGIFLRPSATSELTPFDKNGGIQYNCGEIFMNLNFLVPRDINQSTGLMIAADTGDQTSVSYKRNVFSGNFRILEITNKISKGIFTQELQTIRYDDSHELEIIAPKQLTQYQIDANNAETSANQEAHIAGVGKTDIKSLPTLTHSQSKVINTLINVLGPIIPEIIVPLL